MIKWKGDCCMLAKKISVEMEDDYTIEIHFYESFKHQDWETFICRLIEYGYLD